ncbi:MULTISPECIES: SMI1/KNR4 family protein [Brevibacillus]|uniref:SMI1/KNR4 family protein n=1 Tax=Brevibacillus TaxID=55080 RepID=UPI000D0FDDEE|nr:MULTISPECIES: SMI1/KNR4 family protein [Brevibacillus]MED1943937.1 SMI1/KNR4 family protein [Brevibacillus formosus]MED1999691.1 SMI1/KNR4 family protein [Brevibacillus formosus]MED2082172.1 SMI1/KNR4 family protein [Brevibacillus formosus]PSK18901.1 cell wall assembly protein [Brevibacillus sp. NRRL NRS-603]
MKDELMERLKIFLHREVNSKLVGFPASQEEIAKAQKRLNVNFHEDYVHFIWTFWGAYVGLAVYAFSNGSSLGNETVVDLTLRFREQFKELPFAEVLQTSYVITMNGSGDPIIINPVGKVFICYKDTGEIKLLADSSEMLIEENFYSQMRLYTV